MNDSFFRKILVVDDEEIVREVLGEFLSLMNFETDAAEDGLAGLKAIQESDYCAAITDIRMPGLDGLGFLKQSRLVRPDMPVIIITGHGFDDAREEAMAAGAFAFLQKPFGYHQIKEILEKIAPESPVGLVANINH